MNPSHCLNCHEAVSGNFCANCGQKTDTHRITFKHFFMHDLLHGVWHIERGILFTLKETFLRPGQAAMDYIGGKRVRYYNVFYLGLLLIGLNIILAHLYDSASPQLVSGPMDQNTKMTAAFFSKYSKLITLSVIPLLSVNALLFFRRLRLNLSEHFILAGFSLLGIICISIVYYFVDFLVYFEHTPTLFGYLKVLLFFAMPLFPVWSYWNAFRKQYSGLGLLWRLVVFFVTVILELALLLSLISKMVTGDFGVSVSI